MADEEFWAMEEGISLSELQRKIKTAVDGATEGLLWVRAEIGEIKFNPAGHCYLDLVDYSGDTNEIIAKARAVIWNRTAVMLIPYFETTAGTSLAKGMHVLLKVQVQYSEVYGLTLNVMDIDPSFTVGELELKRQQVIKRLQQEKMFEVNSSLRLNLPPSRLAVISSPTAAGYRDFVRHLTDNEMNIKFKVELYQAPMQGSDSVNGIIAAMDKIAESISGFDAVVIIRGGGSVLDLATFDDYDLALNIAQYPLPVFTGIGHDHDYHVADMVAYKNFKTPTAVADYILELYMEQYARLENIQHLLQVAVKGLENREMTRIEKLGGMIAAGAMMLVERHRHRLEMLNLKLKQLDPSGILDRGYAIVAGPDGKRISTVEALEGCSEITLFMRDGSARLNIDIEKIEKRPEIKM